MILSVMVEARVTKIAGIVTWSKWTKITFMDEVSQVLLCGADVIPFEMGDTRATKIGMIIK